MKGHALRTLGGTLYDWNGVEWDARTRKPRAGLTLFRSLAGQG